MAVPEGEQSAREGLFSFLSRRKFLKASLVAGGALLGAGGGGLLLLRGRAPNVDGLKVLDAHEYQTVKSLVEIMFPRTDAIPIDAESMDLPRAFDDFLTGEPEHNVKDFKKALVLIEFGPLVFDRRISTFSRLDPEERLAHWNDWATSDSLLRRRVSVAMRKFFNLVFFDHEAVWRFIGYPGPSMLRSRSVR
ncbi:MAG: gluconate 2-dehydrogenase subunit 3 family protein [Myxococcales bacterium]|nr:gluconate 2-dehydrogenase subunit 3 family protein [Myxococcales bacterium]